MRAGIMILRVALVERTGAVRRVRAMREIGVLIRVCVRWWLCRVSPVGIVEGLVVVSTNIGMKVSWVVERVEGCSRDEVIVPVPSRIGWSGRGRRVIKGGGVYRCC